MASIGEKEAFELTLDGVAECADAHRRLAQLTGDKMWEARGADLAVSYQTLKELYTRGLSKRQH